MKGIWSCVYHTKDYIDGELVVIVFHICRYNFFCQYMKMIIIRKVLIFVSICAEVHKHLCYMSFVMHFLKDGSTCCRNM